MRTFVYLDTGILNSYISQINGGLIARKQLESMESLKEGNIESSGTLEANNSISLNLPFVSGQTSTKDAGITNMQELSKYDYGKELIEKVLHDNAVQDLIDTMTDSGELKINTERLQIGDYVLFKADYDVLDINYWNDFAKTSAFSNTYEFDKPSKPTGNRQQRRAQNKDNTKTTSTEDPSIQEIISALCQFMPCPQLIMTEKHAIPIDDRFLRESLQSIRFKYCSQMAVLGRITSTPQNATKPQPFMDPRLSVVSSKANSVIFDFLLAKVQWITTPIALYFE